MNLNEINPPIIELPINEIWHRVQLLKKRRVSVFRRGFILAPAGGLSGRFDLPDELTAYLADSELTALYESLFRRETRNCSLYRLKERGLVTFQSIKRLRLIDLRGSEEKYPVLQSLRYESTQAFALECRKSGVDGILFASAQHPYHGCLSLFETGIAGLKCLTIIPLVHSGSDRLHQYVVDAANRSQVQIVP
jgi:hypothetical protein